MNRPSYGGLLAVTALAVVGSVVLLAASSRVWARVGAGQAGVRSPAVGLAGSELVPVASAVGIAGLASVAAIIGARGALRRACGLVVVLLGAVVVVGVVMGTRAAHVRDVAALSTDVTSTAAVMRGDVDRTGWPVAGVVGGVGLVLAGGLVVAQGHRWPGLSARYERRAPASSAPADDSPEQLWQALDRGEDPTV